MAVSSWSSDSLPPVSDAGAVAVASGTAGRARSASGRSTVGPGDRAAVEAGVRDEGCGCSMTGVEDTDIEVTVVGSRAAGMGGGGMTDGSTISSAGSVLVSDAIR